jgi:hypothetical protein
MVMPPILKNFEFNYFCLVLGIIKLAGKPAFSFEPSAVNCKLGIVNRVCRNAKRLLVGENQKSISWIFFFIDPFFRAASLERSRCLFHRFR